MIRIRQWFMKKEAKILEPPPRRDQKAGVSFEQMGKAVKWLVKPWRKP